MHLIVKKYKQSRYPLEETPVLWKETIDIELPNRGATSWDVFRELRKRYGTDDNLSFQMVLGSK